MYVFRDIKHEHSFFVILDHFLPFCPTIDPKIKTWRNYHFTNVYHKWQSYQVWFLSYGVRQTEFFVIFNHFLPFYFPNNLENQNIEKRKKKFLEISSFYTCVPKIRIIWCMLPEICSATDISFCRFGSFFALLPQYWPQILKFRKNVKKTLEIFSCYIRVP